MTSNQRVEALTTLLGCSPTLILAQQNADASEMATLRFAHNGVAGSILEYHNLYFTIGLAGKFSYEFVAFSPSAYLDEPIDGYVLSVLNWLANHSFKENIAFSNGEWFDWGEPFVYDCLMSKLYFVGFPRNSDSFYEELKLILGVKEIFTPFPISDAEALLLKKKGPISLLKAFEKADLFPIFHVYRKSAV